MEIIKREGLFRLTDKGGSVIFTDEKQLNRIIESPENSLFDDEERGFSYEKRGIYDDETTSLLKLVKDAEKRGGERFEASYDFFFGGTTRCNYPSSETTLKCFKVIHDVAKEHGMTFGASILNPLDIGGGYVKDHEEVGFTYQFLETDIKPDGSYCAPMLCQKQWNNNKGPIKLEIAKLLCFAFNEEKIGDSPYYYVDENAIQDISTTATVQIHEDTYTVTNWGYGTCKMEFSGKWENPTANRALCVVVYKTPELDYFAPSAFEYFKEVLDMHNARGIRYDGFYSDEMHIQFDWDQVAHFGHSEINTRYITPSFMKEYAHRYGEKFLDFPKYLIYIAYHQHDFLPGEAGRENAQHVFGKSQKAIYDTWLFRNRYFELLQSTVVDLCCRAKDYAESLWGGPIMTRAHATWQESPTCDQYYTASNDIGGYNMADAVIGFDDIKKDSPVERRVAFELAKEQKAQEMGVSRYDYTPWYDWSASIRERTAACYDYFKWNDYLSGGNNDFPEGGNLDRDYYGQAMSCSLSALNRFKLGYYGNWGMPNVVKQYMNRAADAYGNSTNSYVQGLRPRVTDVFCLYPIELNDVEERFGSWMIQYGYCNYITEEQLLKHAEVTADGKIRVMDNEYRTLVVLFEPFLDPDTAEIMKKFVKAGGKLIWTSIYPVLTHKGEDVRDAFCDLFGIRSIDNAWNPIRAKGRQIEFTGKFAGIAPMEILNDYLVDYVYPFEVADGSEACATLEGRTVASYKAYPNGGCAVYAGFRPRDDQSRSLGKDVDTFFRMLMAVNAYRPDSLEARSRDTASPYLMNLFPNGAVTVAPHYRTIYEAWEGTFFREDEMDKLLLKDRVLPDKHISLNGDYAGQKIRFEGENYLAVHAEGGKLLGYEGEGADTVEVNGVSYKLADKPCNLMFSFLDKEYLADGVSELMLAVCRTAGTEIRLPVGDRPAPKAGVCGLSIYRTEKEIPFRMENGCVVISVDEELAGKRLALAW